MNAFQLYIELQKAIEESPIIPACQTTDPEIWYGTEDEPKSFRFRQAKQLCSFFPAIKECATNAIVADEPFGVWGGLSPEERKNLKNKHKKRAPKLKLLPIYPLIDQGHNQA
jgi:WhiB family redox-sensing transcriptional regulator